MVKRLENSFLSEASVRAADSAYKGIPTYSAWLGAADAIALPVWDDFLAALRAERERATPESLARAREFALRSAAIDSGAIEGLYEVDRGFTISVASQAAAWEAAVEERGAHVRPLFESQLAGLELVLDAVTQETPISEAWLRRLHEVVCGGQDSYRVRTSIGFQEQPLPKGQYKQNPNHVELPDGSVHSYAPVDLTPIEMARLFDEFRGDALESSHPVLQASYAHYALVAIHPFADGNGRVARALASVFLYRAASVPLVIFADQKPNYLDALGRADRGDQHAFVRFVFDRTVDVFSVLTNQLRAARTTQVEESLAALSGLYVAHHGLTHEELDAAAGRLAATIRERFDEALRDLDLPETVRASVKLHDQRAKPVTNGYRAILAGSPAMVQVLLRSGPPADSGAIANLQVVVAGTSGAPFGLLVEELDSPDRLQVRAEEVHPVLTESLELKLNGWIRWKLGTLVEKLHEGAQASLRRNGGSP